MTTGRIIPIKGGVKRTPAQRRLAKQRYDAFQQYYRDGDKQPLRDLGLSTQIIPSLLPPRSTFQRMLLSS